MGGACPIPDDIVEEILLKLPVKSLLPLKAVSKHFYSLISSPNFITNHHHNSKTSPSSLVLSSGTLFRSNDFGASLEKLYRRDWINYADPVWIDTVIGDANGLLCIRGRLGDDRRIIFILWNPATRQHKYIRSPRNAGMGFGYHSEIQDYKFFGIPNTASNCWDVLSLRHGTWREIRISHDHWLEYDWQYQDTSAMVVDGVWYRNIIDRVKGRLRILSFDLKKDALAWIPSPVPPGTHYAVTLGLQYNKLCLFVVDLRTEVRTGGQLDMWVMYEKASWTKMFTTNLRTTKIPVNISLGLGGALQGSRVLLHVCDYSYRKSLRRSFFYDLSTNSWGLIPKQRLQVYCIYGVRDYVESLVSPMDVYLTKV